MRSGTIIEALPSSATLDPKIMERRPKPTPHPARIAGLVLTSGRDTGLGTSQHA